MRHLSILVSMGILTLLFITLTTSPPATAVSLSDQHYSHTFTVGNNTWEYVDIVRTNPSIDATVELWFWSSNITVKIVESNVENVTVHTADLINGTGLTDAQVRSYLALVGRLTVVVSGEGTDNFTIEDCPEVNKLFFDDISIVFTWSNNNLFFSIPLSDHTLIIDFTTVEQINSFTQILIDGLFPMMVVVMMMSYMFVTFKKTVGRIIR